MSAGIVPFGALPQFAGLSPDDLARLARSQQPASPSPVDGLLFDRAGMGGQGGFSGTSGTIVPPAVAAQPEPETEAPAPRAMPTPPARPLNFGSLPAPTALAEPAPAPASPAPTTTGGVAPSPTAAPEPASGGSIFGRLGDPRVANVLLGISQGLLSTKGFGHPVAETAGEIGGGVAGTVPLVLAAPAAFGAGAGGLLGRSAISAASGMALGGADAAVRSDGDLTQIKKGAAIGGTLGAVAPGLGQVVGAGAKKVAEAIGLRAAPSAGMGAQAMDKLASDAANAGGTGAVRVRLGELGPESMLLDASPSFEGRAQGLAVLPDTREAIVNPLRQRAAGANARLAADVDTHLGPTLDPAAFQAEWQRAYGEAVPPLYRDALSQPVQVDTSGVLETIGRLGAHEKGGAELALRRAWGLLHAEQDVPGLGRAVVPDRNPEALHNAKEALDAMIAHVQAQQGSAAASELRALSAVRSGVNGALEAQVPGYAEANRTAQHFFQQRDAFDGGQRLLNGGREAARPAQVAADTAAMTSEVQQAQRLGLRTEVDRLVGTQLNDRLALRKALMGEGDYNRARMGTVFGEEPTAGIAGAVDREAAFDAANRRIVDNSMTAQRVAAAADLAPRDVRPSASDAVPAVAAAVGGVQAGLAAQAAKLGIKGAQAGFNAAGRARDIARNKELAEALTRRQGEQLDALLEAIGARQAAERMASGVGRAAQIGTTAATVSQADRAKAYVPFGFLPARR